MTPLDSDLAKKDGKLCMS